MAKIAKSTTYYTIANALPQAIGFLFLPIYSRYMTPSEFGIISAMETLALVFSTFVCFSLDRAAQRFYFDDTEPDKQKKMLSTLFISVSCFAGCFLILALLSEPILQPIFRGVYFYPYFVFCIFNVSLNSLSLITVLYYQVSEQPRKYMLLKVFRFVFQIILTLFFIVWLKEGAKGQLKAELISICVFLPVYLAIANKHFGWQFDINILKKALSYSWPFIPTLLIAWVLNLSDRLFLERYLGLEDVGIYAMGYKIAMALFVLTSAFSMAYTPIFYKLANSSNQSDAKDKLYKYSWYAAIAFIFIMFTISLFAREITNLALDAQYRQACEIIRILLISNFLSAIMGITSVLYLMQAKKTKLNLYIALQAAILNVVLNFLLIPPYGMHGAAVATVLSMAALTVIHYQMSKSAYFIPVPWVKIILIMIVLMIIVAFYHFYLEIFPLFSITTKVIILAVAFLFIYLKTGRTLFYTSRLK